MLLWRSASKRSEWVPFGAAAIALLGLLLFRMIERQTVHSAHGQAVNAQFESHLTEELLTAVLDAETGQRGFLLTGDRQYLTPYEQAVQSIPGLLADIRKNSASIDRGPQIATALEHSVRQKMGELTLTITLYRKNPNAALEIVRTNRGNGLTDRIRGECQSLYNAYLRSFVKYTEYSRRFSLMGLSFEMVLGASVLALLFWGTKRLNASLGAEEALRQDYQLLTGKLQRTREEERARLARDIHDDLGQVLTGLKMDISMIGRRLVLNDREAALQKLSESSSSVDTAIQSLRRLAMQLRPSILDQLGLGPALQWQARDFESRLGVAVQVTIPEQEPELSQDQRTAFFRIAQEALTNVARHARAQSVRIGVFTYADCVELLIEDDGVGMPSNPRQGSLGLLGMQERANLIGAEFRVTPGEHSGTAVRVLLPISSPVFSSSVSPGERVRL
jgi:signal transduction histidine kinase